MKSTTWRRRDLAASLMVILVGLFCAIEALSYDLGTASRMGPGFFPFAVSLFIVAVGLGIGLVDARAPEAEHHEVPATKPWRALIVLPVSILVFAAIVGRFGLAPATFLAVFVSTFAEKTLTLQRSLIIAISMTIVCVLIFRVLLGIQVRSFIW